MAIVPSGKGRIMVGQLFKQAQLEERDSVQQSPAVAPDATPGAENALDTSLPASKPNALQNTSQSPTVQPQPQKEQITKVDTSKMKKHYFQVLNDAGVQVRAIDPENRNKFFTRGGDPVDGSAKGIFFVPTYLAAGKELDDLQANELAKKVIEPFPGVQITNWQETKGGYRFDWQNKNERTTGVTGTSFDELLGDGRPAKAASTMGELIKSRKDDLYNVMRKIAQGDK